MNNALQTHKVFELYDDTGIQFVGVSKNISAKKIALIKDPNSRLYGLKLKVNVLMESYSKNNAIRYMNRYLNYIDGETG